MLQRENVHETELNSQNCRDLLQAFALCWGDHAKQVDAVFCELAQNLDYSAYSREVFCGLPTPSLVHSQHELISPLLLIFEDFLTGLEAAFLKVAESFCKPKNLSVSGYAFLLCIEGLINAALMRMRAGQGLSCSFASLVAFSGAVGRRIRSKNPSSGSLSFELRLDGVLFDWSFEGARSVSLNNKRSVTQNDGTCFHWTLPVRATSTVLLNLASKPFLLQKICAAFPLQKEADRASTNFERQLALVRLVQREVCFVTEEWEFRNAVLAVDFTKAREWMLEGSLTKQSNLAIAKLEEVAQARDELALWFASTLAELQQSYLLLEPPLSSESWQASNLGDLSLELAAVQAVVAAAMQKIFLPASVSRHDYHPLVIDAVYEWAAARFALHSDDLACELTMLACGYRIAQHEFEERCYALLLRVQNESSLDWILSYDPSAALKSFCWSLRPEQHFCLLLTFAYVLKQKSYRQWCATNDSLTSGWTFDAYWSSQLVSCLQMPQTFPQIRSGRIDARREFKAFAMPQWTGVLQETLLWFSDSLDLATNESYKKLWLKGFSVCLSGSL